MGPSPREVIHVAFGASSCHVAAHLLNLQGLAATATTSSSAEDDTDENDTDSDGHHHRRHPLCQPQVTHSLLLQGRGTSSSNSSRAWVPRALLVDFDDETSVSRILDEEDDVEAEEGAVTSRIDAMRSDGSLLYHGSSTVEPVSRNEMTRRFQRMMFDQGRVDDAGDDDNRDDRYGRGDSSDPNKRRKPRTAAAATKTSPFERRPWDPSGAGDDVEPFVHDSRYEASATRADRRSQGPPPASYKSSTAAAANRHVDWDRELSNEREPDSDDDNDEVARQQQRRMHQEQQRRLRLDQDRQHHSQLEEMWDRALFPSSAAHDDDRGPSSASTSAAPAESHRVIPSWKDFYRMAPHSPASLLSSHGAADSSSLREAAEDRFRTLLEECDACQGIVQHSSSPSSLGLEAQQLLEFHKDECPSGRRFSIFMTAAPVGMSPQDVARCYVRNGWLWSHLVDNSTAVLPLQGWGPTSSSNSTSAMAAAMSLASALEVATLPYRIHKDDASSTRTYGTGRATNSFDGYNDHAPLPMSLASFLAVLTPSPVHTVLELDAHTPLDHVVVGRSSRPSSSASVVSTTEADPLVRSWQSHLLQGTTVERRILNSGGIGGAASRSRPDMQLPGAWLQHPSPGGLVRLWSPQGGASSLVRGNDDRSHHQHFALMTSLRTGTSAKSATRRLAVEAPASDIESADDYLTCLMQGMGIRYRPEQSLANVVTQQSLNQLVENSAVGTYWKAMLKKTTRDGVAVPTQLTRDGAAYAPVLAVLGNSTRSHAFLSDLAAQMRDVVVAPRRTAAGGGSTSFTSVRNGWFRRDASLGLVPEEDDCLEALSHCLDVRDRYRPPHPAPDEDDDLGGEDF